VCADEFGGRGCLSFRLPIVSLLFFAAVAVVAGILAAIVPARRAARLNVLAALQYESAFSEGRAHASREREWETYAG
jgi:hypothetical protein